MNQYLATICVTNYEGKISYMKTEFIEAETILEAAKKLSENMIGTFHRVYSIQFVKTIKNT